MRFLVTTFELNILRLAVPLEQAAISTACMAVDRGGWQPTEDMDRSESQLFMSLLTLAECCCKEEMVWWYGDLCKRAV